jgi:hypothetical protein
MNESWSEPFEVLHWVAERFERNRHSVEVGEALRVFPEEQYDSVRESLRRVSTHTYLLAVNGREPGTTGGSDSPMVKEVTGRALRIVGSWPDNAEVLADRILAVLAEGAENEPDPDRRVKLKAGLKGFGGMTCDVLVDVTAAAIARYRGAAWSWPRARDTTSREYP